MCNVWFASRKEIFLHPLFRNEFNINCPLRDEPAPSSTCLLAALLDIPGRKLQLCSLWYWHSICAEELTNHGRTGSGRPTFELWLLQKASGRDAWWLTDNLNVWRSGATFVVIFCMSLEKGSWCDVAFRKWRKARSQFRLGFAPRYLDTSVRFILIAKQFI
jgi:hypothetical protein